MSSPLKPKPTLLVKLGSIAVHLDEAMSDQGHPFDALTMKALLDDPELKTWLAEMDNLALLPKRRSA